MRNRESPAALGSSASGLGSIDAYIFVPAHDADSITAAHKAVMESLYTTRSASGGPCHSFDTLALSFVFGHR